MLDDYSVPYTGLESEIKAGLRARNDVAHRGVGRPDVDLLRHTAVLREVALRTILTLLGYAGRYYSHVNGEEERAFPPTGATSIRTA
mgnify:FL=1